MLDALGDNWTVILTDPTEDDLGDDERLAFVFDRERLEVSGLACELVVPLLATAGGARDQPRSPVRPHSLRGRV